MPNAKKTNVARLLDAQKINYTLHPYDAGEVELGAQHVADQLGEPIERVFKTLVLCGDRNGHFVCVIPGNEEINLKMAAKISGNKSCDLIPVKELLPLTGYIRGGCSPIGMKKHFPTFVHESCQAYETIFVSAGMRGLQVEIAPTDLQKMTNAQFCQLY